ncbi:uncharacterized protein V1516DRAFT_100830 [Lipomyces oligophaga]|uniref:uncharacterized protein n=1 Tax=Lipomyces oligophaga TaxID=45792 RepID=UPI0034CD0CA2
MASLLRSAAAGRKSNDKKKSIMGFSSNAATIDGSASIASSIDFPKGKPELKLVLEGDVYTDSARMAYLDACSLLVRATSRISKPESRAYMLSVYDAYIRRVSELEVVSNAAADTQSLSSSSRDSRTYSMISFASTAITPPGSPGESWSSPVLPSKSSMVAEEIVQALQEQDEYAQELLAAERNLVNTIHDYGGLGFQNGLFPFLAQVVPATLSSSPYLSSMDDLDLDEDAKIVKQAEQLLQLDDELVRVGFRSAMPIPVIIAPSPSCNSPPHQTQHQHQHHSTGSYVSSFGSMFGIGNNRGSSAWSMSDARSSTYSTRSSRSARSERSEGYSSSSASSAAAAAAAAADSQAKARLRTFKIVREKPKRESIADKLVVRQYYNKDDGDDEQYKYHDFDDEEEKKTINALDKLDIRSAARPRLPPAIPPPTRPSTIPIVPTASVVKSISLKSATPSLMSSSASIASSTDKSSTGTVKPNYARSESQMSVSSGNSSATSSSSNVDVENPPRGSPAREFWQMRLIVKALTAATGGRLTEEIGFAPELLQSGRARIPWVRDKEVCCELILAEVVRLRVESRDVGKFSLEPLERAVGMARRVEIWIERVRSQHDGPESAGSPTRPTNSNSAAVQSSAASISSTSSSASKEKKRWAGFKSGISKVVNSGGLGDLDRMDGSNTDRTSSFRPDKSLTAPAPRGAPRKVEVAIAQIVADARKRVPASVRDGKYGRYFVLVVAALDQSAFLERSLKSIDNDRVYTAVQQIAASIDNAVSTNILEDVQALMIDYVRG